jgi:hypothetical protein
MKTDLLELTPSGIDSILSTPARIAAAAGPPEREPAAVRRRGRPIEMAPEEVLTRIGALSSQGGGLFRTHRSHPALYARARRLFGSWEGAVRAAGLDYAELIAIARQRASRARRLAWRRTGR